MLYFAFKEIYPLNSRSFALYVLVILTLIFHSPLCHSQIVKTDHRSDRGRKAKKEAQDILKQSENSKFHLIDSAIAIMGQAIEYAKEDLDTPLVLSASMEHALMVNSSGNTDSAIGLLKSCLGEEYKWSRFFNARARMELNLGIFYNVKNQPDTALNYIVSAENLNRKKNDPYLFNRIVAIKGWSYEIKEDYAAACTLNMSILDSLQEDTMLLTGVLQKISVYFGYMNRHDQSLKYFRRTRQYMRSDYFLASYYQNLGEIYFNLGQNDSAMLNYRKSLAMRRHMNDTASELESELAIIKGIRAIHGVQTAYDSLTNLNSKVFLSYPSSKGKYHILSFTLAMELRNMTLASNHIQQTLNHFSSIEKRRQLPIYPHLVDYFRLSGNLSEAFKYQSEFLTLLKHFHEAETNQMTATIQAEYNQKEDQQKIDKLNFENQLYKVNLENQKKINIL
ncbi:MAG: tetratricopeptide repeat protein, partial [Flavobacteriales bacterium]|nr:tetratricopeptide repeat protein [Flavobacteriales bacterium]